MAVFKKIMKNLFILIGVLLGLAFICLGVMYFTNVSVFGIKFKKTSINDVKHQSLEIADYSKVSEIVVYNSNPKLNFVANEKVNFFDIYLQDDCFGLVKKSDNDLDFTSTIKENEDGKFIITINVTSISGWLNFRNTNLTVMLPKEVIENDGVKYTIHSDFGEVIFDIFKEDEDNEVGQIDFNSKKANFILNDNVSIFNAKTTKGKITSKFGVGTLDFSTKKGDLKFNTVAFLNVDTENSYISGNDVNAKFTFKSAYGKIKINNIGRKYVPVDLHIRDAEDIGFDNDYQLQIAECVIETKSADIEIKNLIAKIRITTTSGDVEIKNVLTQEVYNNSIETTKGSIEIDNVYAKQLKLKTKSGKIDASVCGTDANALLEVESNSGKIEIDSNATYVSHVSREQYVSDYVYTEVKTYAGKVKSVNYKGRSIFEDVNFVLEASSTKGAINAEFVSVCSGSKIETQTGKILVEVTTGNSSTINAYSEKGKVDVDIPSQNINKVEKNNQMNVINIGGGNPAKQLNVTSQKSRIRIREAN